jgi:hypothetical protein
MVAPLATASVIFSKSFRRALAVIIAAIGTEFVAGGD